MRHVPALITRMLKLNVSANLQLTLTLLQAGFETVPLSCEKLFLLPTMAKEFPSGSKNDPVCWYVKVFLPKSYNCLRNQFHMTLTIYGT